MCTAVSKQQRHAAPHIVLQDSDDTVRFFAARGLASEAAAVPVPERELTAFKGAIATSDTALIEAHDPVVDLAGEIIRQHPGWRPLNLNQPEAGNGGEA